MDVENFSELVNNKLTNSARSTIETYIVSTKIMEEKHTYTYRKLVVPMSMRSIYWKFFGFPATEDGDIVTKVKIVCILCRTQIAYNRNTSNLRMHLQNKHTQELIELESNKPPKKDNITQDSKDKKSQKKISKASLNASAHIYTTNIDGTVEIDGDIQFVTDPNINWSSMEEDVTLEQPVRVAIKGNESTDKDTQITYVSTEENPTPSLGIEGKSLADAIAEFLIIDMQSPEIVDRPGFRRLIETLNWPCEVPNKNKLELDIVPKLYETFKESVSAQLSCINGEFGLAIEEWRSYTEENFVTISICYQNPGESSLITKVLSTLHAPMEWSETHWGSAIDSMLTEWDLKVDKITAVVLATTRSELISALADRNLTLLPCLLHTLQMCAQACFDNPDVAAILAKCRAIIGAITGNSAASGFLAEQERLLELEENSMVMDYPPVWLSTYNMLEQMSARRNIISSLVETVEGIDQENIKLSNDQWKIMEDLISVLESFKVTIITLADEKMPIISLLKPLFWQLVSFHMKPKDTDSDFVRSFKESLCEMLIERYADSNVTLLLQIAATLDPRFKKLPYATDEEKVMTTKQLKEMLTKLIRDEEGFEHVEIKMEDTRPTKKSRLSGMELLLGNYCTPKSSIPVEEKANLELVQYQSEPHTPLDSCPLQWWAKISAKCPNLSKLARRYNCVPACCAPPARIPAQVQIDYDTKRAAMPPHLIDKMLFLHENHSVISHPTNS